MGADPTPASPEAADVGNAGHVDQGRLYPTDRNPGGRRLPAEIAAGRRGRTMGRMHVVATAGHVDHGKSTLVRALTQMDPDRLAEEKRRGLTVDLGYAWTTGASGEEIAFVDVPGHRRFIGNMLAGIGPAPAVMFVVAADGGWEAQSAEHLAALDALGISAGLLVVTRADLVAPERAAEVVAAAQAHLRGTSLEGIDHVVVSARTGAGLPELRAALDELVAATPAPDVAGPPRLWIDRVFPVTGAGTVVTGTLSHGTLRVGDELDLDGRRVRVRGLESLGRPRESACATARVAVNLRGVDAADVHRGQALLAPGAIPPVTRVDVRLVGGAGVTEGASEDAGVPEGERVSTTPPRPPRPGHARAGGAEEAPGTGQGRSAEGAANPLPQRLTLHAGTAAVPVHVRPLGPGAARLTLDHPLPLATGDRLLLRDPGDDSGAAIWGARVAEPDPADLRRRAAAARRGLDLAQAPGGLAAEVDRRGTLTREKARRLGLLTDGSAGAADTSGPVRDRAGAGPTTDSSHGRTDDAAGGREAADPAGTGGGAASAALRLADAPGVRVVGDLFVSPATWAAWTVALEAAVDAHAATHPLDPRPSVGAATRAAGLPEPRVTEAVAHEAGLEVADGRVASPGTRPDLGAAEAGLAAWEARLRAEPFAAPEADDLAAAGLDGPHLAAAAALGRIVRLRDDVVLLPTAPALAMRELAALPQPFTTSQARQALGTTRRVAIPLLEHLDERRWTRRLDAGHREIRR